MKNLSKIIFPLTLSIASFNSIDSKAQNFLPGKFKNYKEKEKGIDSNHYYVSDRNFMEVVSYDVDGDGMKDVKELTPFKALEDTIVFAPKPCAYYLFKNPQDKNPLFIYDPQMDGWNQNEEIINDKESNYTKPIL